MTLCLTTTGKARIEYVMEHILSQMAWFCKTEHCFIRVFRNGKLVHRVQLRQSIFQSEAADRLIEPIIQEVHITGKRVVICPYSAETKRIPEYIFDRLQYIAVLPLRYRGQWIGAAGIAFLETMPHLTDNELQLLQKNLDLYAILIGDSFRNFFLYRRVRRIQKIQKKQLQLSQYKLNCFVQKDAAGIWKYNTETDMYNVEEGLFSLHHATMVDQEPSMTFDAYLNTFVYPDDRWKLRQLRKKVLEGQKFDSKKLQYRIVCKDGTVRYVLTQRFLEEKNDRNVVNIYGYTKDITNYVYMEEERQQQQQRIRQMAYYDSLTQLPNRQYLHRWLNQEMKWVRKGKNSGVIFFIDLDNLKMINDAYGHACGDAIIVTTAMRLREVIKTPSFISRVGGDEFVMVLRGIYTYSEMHMIAIKICDAVCRKQKMSGLHFHMTVSMGIAVYPKDGNTTTDILKNADNAMCTAKEAGKDQYKFYTREMQDWALERIYLIGCLHEALQKNELFLVYQPQIDIRNAAIISFEALLRWNSHTQGCIPPAKFIPLAEQSGFIHVVGEWVLQHACCFMRQLLDQGWNGRIDINVSPKQLAAVNFVENTCAVIQKAGISFQHIGFEITESLCIAGIIPLEEAVDKLSQLTALGIHISMDDFGTGYSSLTLLDELPFHTIKLDKSFIDKIETDAHRENFIGSIIHMIHTLDKKVVAEGVETEKQLEHLQHCGCDYIQGYLFSKPLSKEEAFGLLLTGTDACKHRYR
ncbi:EAL domain-containing protein [Megasphaera paucivorans]|uniref:Diguanylate cyclase (GGDEF) domain-containing protein n=1 Tax=Megasphaera paucivorans TaxID=349095 RepID=A0A1G9U258_9FIRM|nr:EAL domain-containing protein [Megasphaera paucivorans]SDM53883.1 diguanylate cyclase (GGDEF) domain-containing protein [Megasphaera paucivorans]